MSAFNPLPDQLQQDSGSPAQDVMAPPDQQAAAAPQPAATPNFPPSPDQGGPVPQGSQPDPDAGSNVHGWRAVLKGALSGLENHLAGAGKGLLAGGVVGSVVGAISPDRAANALQAQGALQTARVQQAQAQAKTAMEDANFLPQQHDVQMGQAQINTAILRARFDTMPHDFQQKILQEGQEASANLQRQGITPAWTGTYDDMDVNQRSLMAATDNSPLNVVHLPNADGTWSVYEIPAPDKTYDHSVEVTIGYDEKGEPIKKTFYAGQISIARSLNLETAAMADHAKVAGKIQVANQTGVTAKNEGAAHKAEAAANAAPKVENMLVGSMPDGQQVAGTQQDLQAAGATGITKLPADEAKKVVVARQLISPQGLFASVNQDIRELDKNGQLGVAATRWNDFLTSKVGDGPEFAKLRADMGLLGTALMQAHVGARGSHEMLEHFTSLADYRISDAATLRAALGREFNYVTEKAMLPKKAGK
jgi:hypothetical protein